MWPDPHEIAALVTFTEEIVNGKLHFLFSGVIFMCQSKTFTNDYFYLKNEERDQGSSNTQLNMLN